MEALSRQGLLVRPSGVCSIRKQAPNLLEKMPPSSFMGVRLLPATTANVAERRSFGSGKPFRAQHRALRSVTCRADGALRSLATKLVELPLSSSFMSSGRELLQEKRGRGNRIVCQSLKMEDKYKNLKAKRLLKEMEQLRDRGYDRNGRSTPWGKPKKAKGAGNEGKKKSEMDGDHNGIAPWEKRMRINYGDNVEEQDYGLDYWEDDKRNVAAMRGQHREDVTRGGGTYGGQFARDLRASKRTIIDTADLAQLVAARPGTKTALAAGVAGYSEQFAPEMLEKGSALFEDPLEVQQRMVWYLESIGVDVDAIDLSTVPGTGEEQEEKVNYLVSLGLAQETVADIIGRWPQLLRLSLRKNIIPVIKYLECAWIAFRPEQIVELLEKYPQILYHSFELTLQPRILFLRGVGLTRSQSQDVFLRVPSFFDTRIERSPSTSMAYLGAIGVEMAAMWKVAYGCPEILVRKVNEFLKPRFEGIVSHLALPEEEARRALLQTPELLLIEDLGSLRDELRAELALRGLCPEAEVIESTSEESGDGEEGVVAQSSFGEKDESDELRESSSTSEWSDVGPQEDSGVTAGGLVEGGLTEPSLEVEAGSEGESRLEEDDEAGPSGQTGVQVDVNRIVALFGHRLHEAGVKQTLDKTLGLLGNELEMGPADLRGVLAEYPAVMELEPEDILGKIQALRREGLSTDEIRGMVVADPDWLGVDLEGAFTPKLEFLKVDMERSVNELLDFPNFLCYSLPNRIAVRHQITHEHDKKLSLRRLLGSSPAQFDTAVEKSEWDFEVDELDMAEEAWTIDRAYARQRWEPAKIGAGPVGGLV